MHGKWTLVRGKQMLPEKPLHTFYKYSSLMGDLIQTASEGFLNTENVKGLMMAALHYSSWNYCI
jgi:hypothetical protein